MLFVGVGSSKKREKNRFCSFKSIRMNLYVFISSGFENISTNMIFQLIRRDVFFCFVVTLGVQIKRYYRPLFFRGWLLTEKS